jgi:hypothetical protein
MLFQPLWLSLDTAENRGMSGPFSYSQKLFIRRLTMLPCVSVGLLFSQTAEKQPNRAATGSSNPKQKQAAGASADDTVISPWLARQAAATAKAVLPQAVPISVLNNPDNVDFGPYLSAVRDRISRLWPIYAPFGVPELKKRRAR